MDIFYNSQDSLALIDPNELYEDHIDPELLEEIMKNSANGETEEFNGYTHGNIEMTMTEFKGPVGLEEATVISPPTGTIPSQEDYSGPFGFEFELTPAPHHRSYVYSPLLKQVFIGMNNTLLMEFKTTIELELGFYIRSLLMYTCDDFVCVPVIRCLSHALEDDPQQQAHARGQENVCKCCNFKNVKHVMRCLLSDAEYCYDSKSERHSVRVPVRKQQAGTDFIQIPYSFSCKSSCPTGMQRKPVQIVFTLESKEGEVYGRKVLAIKICSCPKRDKDRQERDFIKDAQLNCISGPKRLATVSSDVPQPPIKSIKMEENNFDDSQTEEDKHRKSISVQHGSSIDHDQYQRLMTRLNNIESKVDRIINSIESKVDRIINNIESKVDRIESALNFHRDILQNRP